MPRYPETIAMAEQAMRHVLSEQEKLLKMKDAADIIGLLLPINELACETSRLLTENKFPASIRKLTKKAKMIEEQADELSIALWRPILISLSAIYERIEESLKRKSGEHGLRADTRAQYHNLRIRLLEQLIGARMLVNNSDLGDENERIWQEFFERQLGPMFRVLRGGHISDYEGNISGQLDLIIVPSNAQVSMPGGSNHGKAQVFVDQVISVIMIKSNLTTSELDKDWKALQSIPCYKEMEKDYPNIKGHPWPFCYIVSAQGDTVEKIKNQWVACCKIEQLNIVPQLVVMLDSGYMYSGARKWPCPRYPGNYTENDQVACETGVNAGLGLAWLVAQQQGRLAVMQNQNLMRVNRFAQLIDKSGYGSGLPPTYSRRFDCSFQTRTIAGVVRWGDTALWIHNKLLLRCLAKDQINADLNDSIPTTYKLPEQDEPITRSPFDTAHYRWFQYGSAAVVDQFVAVEEWLNCKSKDNHQRRVAVFDTTTGEEITHGRLSSLNDPSELAGLLHEIRGGAAS
jgi:hypothetical protein